MSIVKCAECGKEEEYEMKPGFPRKYCKACSAAKKAEFEGKTAPKIVTSDKLLSTRDINIMAQTFTKCYYFGNAAKNEADVLETFNNFVKALESNG